MKILICDWRTSEGAASRGFIDALSHSLKSLNYQTEEVILPFVDDISVVPEQLMAYRLMSLQHSADGIVVLGAPTHVLVHSNKVAICVSEPASLTPELGQACPNWLANCTRAGFKEARLVYTFTEKRFKQLDALAIKAELLPLPPSSGGKKYYDNLVCRLFPGPQS